MYLKLSDDLYEVQFCCFCFLIVFHLGLID